MTQDAAALVRREFHPAKLGSGDAFNAVVFCQPVIKKGEPGIEKL